MFVPMQGYTICFAALETTRFVCNRNTHKMPVQKFVRNAVEALVTLGILGNKTS